VLQLARGLSARLTRSLFYRLVDVAQQNNGRLEIISADMHFDLGSVT